MIYSEQPLALAEHADEIRPVFVESMQLVEHLHFQLIEAIAEELRRRRRRDINAIQALILFKIGDKELTASELRSRGCYFGTNVSYNVNKLVDMDFIKQGRSKLDRRAAPISLTPRGHEIYEIVSALWDKHSLNVATIGGMSVNEFQNMNDSLDRLRSFWAHQIR